MKKDKSKLLIIITLICFSLFGIWYMYKKTATDTLVFKNDIPTPTPDYLLKPAPTPTPEKNIFKVHIIGEIINEGVYEIEEGARIEDVVAAAGGFTDMAYNRSVNLAAKVFDEQQIIIYNKEEVANNANFFNENVKDSKPSKININTAAVDELTHLTGIGESKAKVIVKYREENGKFTSIEQIKNVDGIGDKIFDGIKDDIKVD